MARALSIWWACLGAQEGEPPPLTMSIHANMNLSPFKLYEPDEEGV